MAELAELAELITEGKATDVAACKLARCTRDKGETPE